MRSAKCTENFPYSLTTICYILVDDSGKVESVNNSIESKQDAYNKVKSGEATLYAVWPGQWRSDLFIIDDINKFAASVGIVRDDLDIELPEMVWRYCPYCNDNLRSSYVKIDIKLEGYNGQGYKLVGEIGWRQLVNMLETKFGWKIAVSKLYSSSGNTISIDVLKSTLGQPTWK